ncbi:hypothetical protein [Bacillus thuringiensis]|uniref:hypothetical protein n=1 Tax=Bacillus thuringiensis TaxID=1428 RepID=UPI00211D3F77|nr:hypothetical protein [Bacillus thuringiensis]
MRDVGICNENENQLVVGTVSKAKKYSLHVDEYMQAMQLRGPLLNQENEKGFG